MWEILARMRASLILAKKRDGDESLWVSVSGVESGVKKS